MQLSDRVNSMQHSPIRRFNVYAIEAEKKGKKVYHLNIGQPDIETPPCFMEAIRQYDMDFERKDIIITSGGSEALNMIFTSILNPGDEVLIAEPFYTNYHTFVTASGGKVVPLTTKAEDGYDFAKKDLIESAITDRTKAICCISPGNPTGRVLTLADMKLIGEIAIKHDLWIIADEVYREFAYDNRPVTSFGMLPELQDRVIIVDSVSKRFSACGARIGCIVSRNAGLMDGIMKIAQGRLCCPTLDQIGAAALYNLDKSYYDEVKAEYEARRDVVYEELMKIPGVICQKPGGAFYMTAKLPVDDIEDFLLYMLTEFEDNGETAMFTPAEGFYGTKGLGSDEMRMAYVLKKEDMRRAVELIRLGMESYNARKAK